jgi:hypothetical protein
MLQQLNELIAQGWVQCQQHPNAPLLIYNYTSATQYAGHWNEYTLQCRGLILNEHGDIVARPFKKFFNIEEVSYAALPNEAFTIYDKMDGSLGILYWIGDTPYIATRGSFASEQAIHATNLLHTRYKHTWPLLDKSRTYLFEIIYPSNKIVLNYKSLDDLILLAVIDIMSGVDCALPNIGFTVVETYPSNTPIAQLKSLAIDNKEGFVIKYASGYRVKIKFDNYIRLHRIITQVSTRSIWDALRSKQSLDEIIDNVPDEFYTWIKKIIAELQAQYKAIEQECKATYKELPTRKDTALYFQTCKYQSVLFALYTGKNYEKIIWKMIEPTYSKPFKHNDE